VGSGISAKCNTPEHKKDNAMREPKLTERNCGLAGPEATGAFATIAVHNPRTNIKPAQPAVNHPSLRCRATRSLTTSKTCEVRSRSQTVKTTA
jgi:hypothetical protein